MSRHCHASVTAERDRVKVSSDYLVHDMTAVSVWAAAQVDCDAEQASQAALTRHDIINTSEESPVTTLNTVNTQHT